MAANGIRTQLGKITYYKKKQSELNFEIMKSLQQKWSLPVYLFFYFANYEKHFSVVWHMQWSKQARLFVCCKDCMISLCMITALSFN